MLLLRVIFLISSVLVLDISSVYNFHNPFVLFLSVPSKGHFFFFSVLLLDIPSVVTFTKDVEIEMELDDGPFKHLRGKWDFKQLGDKGCKITLLVDYEFSNAMMGRALSPIITRVCDTLVDAFIERAGDVVTSL